MIVNGQNYDLIEEKPPIDDALAHYGVMGMKWGIRKDLKSSGSISSKTKKKIKKAVSKASYGKTRRMLNGLESLKADYKGEVEYGKKHQNKSYSSKNTKNVKTVDTVSKDILKSAKNKGYSYDKMKNTLRATKRTKRAVGVGQFLVGLPGSVGAVGVTAAADNIYRTQTGSKNSQYYVRDTDTYKKKKR